MSTRFGKNRAEDILLAAEAGTPAIRHIGGDVVNAGYVPSTSTGAIESTIHETFVAPLGFLSADSASTSQ